MTDFTTTKRQKRGFYGSRFDRMLVGGVPTSSPTNTSFQWDDVFTGSQNAKWKDQIRAQQNATTNASGERLTVDTQHGFYTVKSKNRKTGSWIQYREREGYLVGPSSAFVIPGGIDYSSAENKASAKWIRKANDALRQVNGLETAIEFHKTLEMILGRGNQLRTGIRSFFHVLHKKRRKRMTKPDLRKVVSDTYLEYAFGWRQLVSDISGGCKALNHIGARSTSKPIKAFGEDSVSTVVSSPFTLGPISYPTVTRTTVSTSVRYLGVVVARPRMSTYRFFDEFGIGLRDFVPTIWNVLPYTWLIDTFTNLGDILSAACFSNSYIGWSCRVQRYSKLVEYESGAIAPFQAGSPDEYVVESSGRACKTKALLTGFSRTSATPVIPSFEFQIPGFDRPVTWTNVAAFMSSQTFKWRKYI